MNQIPELRSAFEAGGIDGGLAYLNGHVEHRYTAFYRLDGSVFKNLGLIDKAGEIKPEYLDELQMGDSFCQFVLREGVFTTSDSAKDSRLDGHPYQGVMLAYHGIPVVGSDGKLFGTLCHFDLAQRDISEEQMELFRQAAAMIMQYLPKA